MKTELSPLEALYKVKDLLFCEMDEENYEKETDIIENALKRLETLEEEKQSFDRQLEKKLKALEIIKKKVSVDEDENGLCWFNLIGCASIGITKEEYDLLKEVLL